MATKLIYDLMRGKSVVRQHQANTVFPMIADTDDYDRQFSQATDNLRDKIEYAQKAYDTFDERHKSDDDTPIQKARNKYDKQQIKALIEQYKADLYREEWDEFNRSK